MTQTIEQLKKMFIGLFILCAIPIWLPFYIMYKGGVELYELTFGDKYDGE